MNRKKICCRNAETIYCLDEYLTKKNRDYDYLNVFSNFCLVYFHFFSFRTRDQAHQIKKVPELMWQIFFLVLMDKRQMPFHFTIIVISIITIKDVVINFFVTLMIVTNAHAHREQMTMTWHDHQTIQNDKNYCKIFDYQKKSYLPCSESMMIVSKRRKKNWSLKPAIQSVSQVN